MTTTEPTNTIDVSRVSVEPELCWLNLDDLAPHPDNPRTTVGDLTELCRSIRSHGILEPLVVLPADDDGVYRIIAGHRRHAAGLKVGVTEVPVVIRAMSPVEVIEAMLSENVNRSDLTVAEEVRAIERLMSLDSGVTPAKLCKRIGRSQSWVRSRMAVTILPTHWRTALDTGDLSLAAAEAAASAADLGPDHLDALCERLVEDGWDPSRTVDWYRSDVRRREAYDRAVEAATTAHPVVFTSENPPESTAKRLGELFDTDTVKAHSGEPCHAVVVVRRSYGDGFEQYAVCTEPRRHAPSRVGTPKGSELAADNERSRYNSSGGGDDDSHAKRKGRIARLAHLTETFARQRGGITQADLTRLALRGLIFEAGQEAVKHAATILGHDSPREATRADLLAGTDTPGGLVRVAAAVAAGLAENHMYWSSGSAPCRDYLEVMVRMGWTPDDWTSTVLAHNAEHDVTSDDDDEDEDDGDGGDGGEEDDPEDASD